MRTALLIALALTACKKSPKPSLPFPADAQQMAGGGNVELPEAVVFHTVLRSADHAAPIFRFYEPEMQKRGAERHGDIFEDGNLVHSGNAFTMDSTANPRDPSRPGVWLAVMEFGNETRVDIWESVPRK